MHIAIETNEPVGKLIEAKHKEYVDGAVIFSALYWLTRLAVGFSAALLPFFISDSPRTSTALSITIVIATVFDTIFNPKERWTLYSKASDLLSIAKAKALGTFDVNREQLEILLQTESASLQQLINLSDMVSKIDNATKKPRISPPE